MIQTWLYFIQANRTVIIFSVAVQVWIWASLVNPTGINLSNTQNVSSGGIPTKNIRWVTNRCPKKGINHKLPKDKQDNANISELPKCQLQFYSRNNKFYLAHLLGRPWNLLFGPKFRQDPRNVQQHSSKTRLREIW